MKKKFVKTFSLIRAAELHEAGFNHMIEHMRDENGKEYVAYAFYNTDALSDYLSKSNFAAKEKFIYSDTINL